MSDWEDAPAAPAAPSSQWEDAPADTDNLVARERLKWNAKMAGGEVAGHMLVGGTASAAAKLAGRLVDALPPSETLGTGADWREGIPSKAERWGEAAGHIAEPQTPLGQSAEQGLGRGMSAVGHQLARIPGVDTPAGHAITSAGGELLQDLPIVGTAARLPGMAGSLLESAGARAVESDPFFSRPPDYGAAAAEARAAPPPSPGPLTRADFAPTKPRITPKAGESAQAAAARQRIGAPAAPAPSTAPAAAPESAVTPTAAPTTLKPPSAAPDHRGAPAPDPHYPDFFGAPDNQDLKGGSVSEPEQATRQAAVERGAPTLPVVRDSAITNDYATQGRDWTGKQAGNPVATAQIAAEGQALHSEAARISAETGGQQGVGESAAMIRGRAYQDWHDSTVDALNKHIAATYAAEDESAKLTPSKGEKLKDVLGDDSLIDNANAGAVRSSVVALGKKMGVDLTDPNAPMNAYQLENLRKHANAVYSSAPRFAQAVKNAVDADLPAGAYVRARKLQQIKSDMFDNRDGINQLGPSTDINPVTKLPRPENRTVKTPDVMKTIEGMDPGQVDHIAKTMKRSSSVLKALGDDKAAEAVTDKALKAAQAVQSHFTERWIEEAHKGGGWNTRRANQFLRANQETLASVMSPEQMHQMRNVNSAANVLDMDKRYKGAFAQFTTGAGWLRQRAGRAAEGLLSDLAPPGMNTLGELTGVSEAIRNKLGGSGVANTPENFTRPLGPRGPGRKQGGWIGYHGTRHEFAPEQEAPLGKFDSSKIGTGEGAQVYGHGLYLADEKGVANTYKNAGGTVTKNARTGKPFAFSDDRATARLESKVTDAFTNGPQRSRATDYKMEGTPGSETRRSSIRQQIMTDPKLLSRDKLYMAETLKNLQHSEGNVYHVHVPDQHVAKMLDWDKPLAEQPHVLKALAALKNDKNPYLRSLATDPEAVKGARTGEDLYHDIANIVGIADRSPRKASALLSRLGIPGIRYLDQGSRLAGDGSRNMVLFDSRLARVVGKNDHLPANLPPPPKSSGPIGRQRGSMSFAPIKRAANEEAPAALNIGLHIGDPANGGRVMAPAEALAAIKAAGGRVGKTSVVNSNTEPTLVADLAKPFDKRTLGGLSSKLEQGAIAQRHADGTGLLAGPQAADWGGKYNPDFFRMHSGQTATESHPVLSNLTDEERAQLRSHTTQRLMDAFKAAPATEEYAAAALAGAAKRGWYANSAKSIANVFGPDAPRFSGLLAAMSPQTSVEMNFHNALRTFINWDSAGRPSDPDAIKSIMRGSVQRQENGAGVLPAWENNSIRALTAEDPGNIKMSGPKVHSFYSNLHDKVNEVTNDAWMAAFSKLDPRKLGGGLSQSGPGKSPSYLALSARVRDAAKMISNLTGEAWTPREVQETVWSWAKTAYEHADALGDKTIPELVKHGNITNGLIRSTPDFHQLFSTPEHRGFIEGSRFAENARSVAHGTSEAAVSASAAKARAAAAKTLRPHLVSAAKRLEEVRQGRNAGRSTGAPAEVPDILDL